jgi:hypothetical protein
MDEELVEHREWQIFCAHPNVDSGKRSYWVTQHSEEDARAYLQLLREQRPVMTWSVQEFTVHRTTRALDW